MKSGIKLALFITILLLLISGRIFCQDEETESYFGIQPRILIDAPTAWTLPRGSFD